ncbi:MAG: protein kinase [Acidobacteria bacterium]|nr:protein kinase [Acidobacteriota bacterium]
MRTPERQRQINQLMQAVLASEPRLRAAYLDHVCADDVKLRAEVEALLNGHVPTVDFIPVSQPHEAKTEIRWTGKLVGGRYLIEKELARGGMGVVLLARDQRLNQAVVIKVLLDSALEPKLKEWVERHFKAEIAALSLIDHPGVVRAIDIGELPDGRSYLVMQYVQGSSLRSVMEWQGINLERAGKLLRQLGHALTAAHEHGIIHRDLKPENVMLQKVGAEEYVKLIDFGIATVREAPEETHVKTTMVAGTPHYMAPEQFRGKPLPASDIYAMGVIAFELITGRRPFNADSPVELGELQRAGVKLKPRDLRSALPEAAQSLILKALAFEPQFRPPSARDFGDALARILASNSAPLSTGEGQTLEIGHVLFTDLVGYSKLTIDEQTRLIQLLRETVNASAELQRAQMNSQLICLPTGDGMALVFFGDPMAPVKCAVELARELKRHPEIKLRMGIHSGPVQRIADINQNRNVSGSGINLAQRVMDVGDAGHILLSKATADIVSQVGDWAKYLRDCGEYEVKHGVKLHVFNLHKGELGNPKPPGKARSLSGKLAAPKPWLWLAALLLSLALGVIAWLYSKAAPNPPVTERRLSYSLTVQKDTQRFPGSKPFVLPGEIIFEAGYQVRLNVSSPQSGYLYVLNEGPMQTNGLPDFNVLFPPTTFNNGSAEINANQPIQLPPPSAQPEADWFVFDQEEGVEKIWLVFSEQMVPELEAVKARANPQERGIISNPSQLNAVAQFLAAQAINKPETEKDEAGKQTKLKGQGPVLTSVVKLEHH